MDFITNVMSSSFSTMSSVSTALLDGLIHEGPRGDWEEDNAVHP
jgi:hypothetical protein